VPELTIASFNAHWGRGAKRDQWRPFDVTRACESIDADVLALQESWHPDDGPAQHDEVAAALGYDVTAVPMARGELEPKPRLVGRADPTAANGDGSFSLAVLSRLPITATRLVAMPQLWLDPWSRSLLHVEVTVADQPFTVVATHFSHLEVGSPLQARALRRGLPVDGPAAFVGDMNMWGWTIAAMTGRAWGRAVRGATWPAHRPSHQIDHILVTPEVEVLESRALDHQGSDHLPVWASLRLP
jgi:endonuclease/exonuclease/phosphatase family metal-dependent hydrolase